MEIKTTEFPGLLIIKPSVFEDERGFFYESWNKKKYLDDNIDYTWVQDNHARSQYGVVRGLHYQLNPKAQAKLVRVTLGNVLDAVVDLRKGSPTYGQSFSIDLNDENKLQLLIPKGFAHGYAVLSKTADFQYKCDGFYSKEDEGGIHPLDQKFNINWKIPQSLIQLSQKDKEAPIFENCKNNFVYEAQ